MLDDLEAAGEIRAQVDRLLRRADAYGRFPTPVDDIVAAANLTQADDYLFDETALAEVPADLRRLVRSARQKIRGVIDRRERVVHISPTIEHDSRRRFVALHETTHDLLPHQRNLVYADDDECLSATTRRLFEREANQGAAELLFQRDGFARDAADMHTSIAAPLYLAQRYGSSIHAAVRRYAETHADAVALIVLAREANPTQPPSWGRDEVCASAAWIAQMGTPRWPRTVRAHEQPWLISMEFPGEHTVTMASAAGDRINVRAEAIHTRYKNFVLLSAPRRRLIPRRRVRLAEPASRLF